MVVFAQRYGRLFHCDPMAAVLDRDPSDLKFITALYDAAAHDIKP